MDIDVLQRMREDDHEQVLFCQCKEVGLKAIIAIHKTVLGPALGGTRMWMYASESEALRDALRLSKGMTYKAALAGLKLGGGKAVIIGDPKKNKVPNFFEVYGKFVDTLAGRYITAEDVNTTVEDMEAVRRSTKHVVGTMASHGGSGNPAPFTARGVFLSIKACCERVYGNESLSGKIIGVQGTGQVGSNLIRMLVEENAQVIATDIDRDSLSKVAAEYKIQTVDTTDALLEQRMDVFAPCALGAIINAATIPQLRCRIVAGAANNQLERMEDGDELARRNILYAPDYIANSGGLISVASELDHLGYTREKCLEQIEQVPEKLRRVFAYGDQHHLPPARAAWSIVEGMLKDGGPTERIYTAGK